MMVVGRQTVSLQGMAVQDRKKVSALGYTVELLSSDAATSLAKTNFDDKGSFEFPGN
jgi:hypothetical protein